MIIHDKYFATNFLNKVSYYRFVGYALHYEIFEDRKRTHKYKKDTTFENVVDLYYFDDKLRTILFDAITHIEVAFRTQLNL
jgi:abortive infection bacteriophage resistance protein